MSMRLVSGLLLSLLLLAIGAWGKSFPATGDATLADQQRWGAFTRGYVTDGCWHGTSASTTVTLASCRAFALDPTDPEALQGFEETTARTITYSGGDGTYWLGGRGNPGSAMPGWTCTAGQHYCWIKQDAPPPLPAGMVLLGTSTVGTNALTHFVIMAPWRRTTPYSVPAGTTLTFGVCPEAGRWPLFQADGGTTGLVRFAPGACGHAYPEWWGADPTGLSDSTAAWTTAIAATTQVTPVSTEPQFGLVPLHCEGVYRLSSTAGATALTLPLGAQIVGTLYPAGGGNPQNPCRFEYHGDGIAFGTPYVVDTTYGKIQLSNLQVFDVEGTGTFGLSLNGFAGGLIDNVLVRGFDVGAYFGTLVYYTEIRRLLLYGARTICLDMAGVVNGAAVDVQCNAMASPLLTYGVRVGLTPGFYGTSADLRLTALIETGAGTPLSIDRVRGLDLNLYLEMPAPADNFTTIGAIFLRRIDGGRVHLAANGNVTGGAVPIGIRLFGAPDLANSLHNRNIVFSGWMRAFTTPWVVDAEPDSWGLDFSRLAVQGDPNSTYAEFSTGFTLGNSYITLGGAPLVDQGRGSTLNVTNWKVGDLIWGTPAADGKLGNFLRQVTVAGNPPEIAELLIPTVNGLNASAATATPTVRKGNTSFTVIRLEASATAITDFTDGRRGQCLDVRALGARTVVHGPLISLAGGTNYAMTTGNTLRLCLDDPTGAWREYSRCATCVP